MAAPGGGLMAAPQLRSPTPAGAPIILSPRMPTLTPTSQAAATAGLGLMNGGPPPLVSPAEAGLLYSPYTAEYPFAGLTAASPALYEYPGLDQSAAGTSFVR